LYKPPRKNEEAQMSPVSGTSGGSGVPGVRGDGQTDNDGVQGFATHPDHVGVLGVGGGARIKGDCPKGDGVQGFAKNFDHAGFIGVNTLGVGVKGFSEGHDGVEGFAKDANRAGMVGTNTGTGSGILGQSEKGVGVHATSTNGTGLVANGAKAGFFEGDVGVTDTSTAMVTSHFWATFN
jgi:hypothetical protein